MYLIKTFSYGLAAIAPFSHRLAFNNMPMEIQRLRCKVNFQALAFVPHIRALGDALVNRLRNPPSTNEDADANYIRQVTDARSKQGSGKFVVLHLRFDKVFLTYPTVLILLCIINYKMTRMIMLWD